jgi:hypothetical protein
MAAHYSRVWIQPDYDEPAIEYQDVEIITDCESDGILVLLEVWKDHELVARYAGARNMPAKFETEP